MFGLESEGKTNAQTVQEDSDRQQGRNRGEDHKGLP
jgi:hypothetical protein